jgi:hypothetical protein
MRILFDHGTPAPLQSFLTDHTVLEAKTQGWDTFKNGDLLTAAEAAGFDVLVTTDKNLRYQQNLSPAGDRHRRAWKCAVANPAFARGPRRDRDQRCYTRELYPG